jgi:PAS domain S-box-containing protein
MTGPLAHAADAQPSMTRDNKLDVIAAGTEAIITVDAAGTVSSWNRAAEHLFGYGAGEIVGRPIALLVPEERLVAGELTRLDELVDAQGSVHGFETTRLTKDGRALPVRVSYGELMNASGNATGYSCVIRPLAPASKVADRLHESETLAALRAISAGFAHEIGNPLAGVLGVLQLVARRTREPETRERLASAHVELSRVAHIIRELAAFTRQDGEAAIIDVNEVLRAALTLARYAHQQARVTVAFEPDPGVGPLVGSRNHLLQAFLHLAMNAYEAIGDDEGSLRVTSHAAGNEIRVVLHDTGSGIPAQALPHVFEPFFTTKGSTGLGLFVCRRIIEDELGGDVAAASEPGDGTRFTVRIPVRNRSNPKRRTHRPPRQDPPT